MKRLALSLIISFLTTSAFADGLAQKNLTKISVNSNTFVDGTYEKSVQPKRLIMMCEDCASTTLVDLKISKFSDGTEGRFRSGKTTINSMEKICQLREPKCKLKRVDVGNAVGWITTYPKGSTVVLFKDGDLLTIRSTAGTSKTATTNAKIAIKKLAPQIVGN